MKNHSAQLHRQDFTTLYQDLAPKILRYIMRLCGNSDVAEEILQETFLAMYTHLPSFQGRSSLSTWAYKIATNKLIDHHRNHWGKINVDSELLERTACKSPNPEKQAMVNEDVHRMQQALEKLPVQQKTALYLVRFEGLTYREAAEILNVGLPTVRMRVYYGLLALKRSLGESHNEK